MIVRRRQKNTEEDRVKALKKAREKQRKKMIRTKYGQASLRHAKKGIHSCCYAGAVFLVLAAMLVFSIVSGGKVGVVAGFAGLGIGIFACLGLAAGIRGFKERDRNYITCKVGIGCNAALILGLLSLFFRGLF